MKNALIISTFILSAFAGGTAVWAHSNRTPVKAASIQHVSLLTNQASPSVVSVKVGESVEFDAKDSRYHNLAQGEGNENDQTHDHTIGGLESGIFSSSEGYVVQFKKAGTYTFHDHLHPDIVVTVIAYNSSH